MHISVIIPAHNEEKYLENTLKKLREQNFLDYETIIVCNGCTDQTEKVAIEFGNSQTKVIKLAEANVSIARNKGAAQAQGSLLLFLDADTLLDNSSLKRVAEEFTGDFSIATTKSQPDIPKLKYKLISSLKNLHNQSQVYRGCSGILICKKKDFQAVGGYPLFKVKEHRKLTLKLKKLGKYRVINTTAITSMRRFEEWGVTKASFFWIKQWAKNYLSDLKEENYEIVR